MTATVRGVSVQGQDGSRNVSGVKEYTVIYKVATDDKRDGPNIIMSAPTIPNLGDIYIVGNDVDTSAVVVNKQASRVNDSAWEWEVTITCSNDLEEDPAGFVYQDNPLGKPAEFSYGCQTRKILIPGYFNNPLGPPNDHAWQQGIFAPNGELFNPQPETDLDEPIWRFKKNVALGAINPAAFSALNNCVNADQFQAADLRQLRLKIPEANKVWHKSIGYYWEVTTTIAFRWETWDIQIPNQGTYYFSGGKPAAVWSTTQNRLTKRDDAGNPLLVNLTTNGDINTSATPTFTRIRYFREILFSTLSHLF